MSSQAPKLTSHFVIRAEKEFVERLRRYASNEPPLLPEKLTVSKFTRTLLTWALAHYEAQGSLKKLRAAFPFLPSKGDRNAD